MIEIFIEYLKRKTIDFFFEKAYPTIKKHRKKSVAIYLCFYTTICYQAYLYTGYLGAYLQFYFTVFVLCWLQIILAFNKEFFIITHIAWILSVRGNFVPFRLEGAFFSKFSDYIENRTTELASYLFPIAFFIVWGLYVGGTWRTYIIYFFFAAYFFVYFLAFLAIRKARLEANFPVKLWHITFVAILIIILTKYDICFYPLINLPEDGNVFCVRLIPTFCLPVLLFELTTSWLSGYWPWGSKYRPGDYAYYLL